MFYPEKAARNLKKNKQRSIPIFLSAGITASLFLAIFTNDTTAIQAAIFVNRKHMVFSRY